MNEFPPPKQFLRAALAVAFLAASLTLHAQTQPSLVTPRITDVVNESSLVTLKGTVNPLATAQNDAGPAPADTRVERIQLVLKRSPQQESDLQELITNMHTPGSASYHKWLTPTQFGQQFGPADQDVQAIQAWVQSHGFEVGALHPGKGILEVSGTIGQIQQTFHTSIHRYSVGGQLRYANATDPQIPSALAPVLGGFVSLNNFPVHRMSRTLGKATYDPQTGHATPQWTNPATNSPVGYDLVVSPADFDVQYDLSPLYSAGTNGTGQTVAIINDSNINVNLVNNFRSLFGLSANPPQVIIDGNDPGIDGINNPDGPNYDSIEAYLDVEWSGAVAPNATIDLVIGADTALESGLILAAEHAISSNLAPVMSVSFGACEQSLGSNNQFLNALWEQAAAQGITVLVSSGDSGSAGTDPQAMVCDTPNSTAAHFGLAVSGYASTPYNVAVGGTDFYYSQYQSATTLPTQLGTYWNLTPSTTPKASLITPIPEQPWNDTAFGLNIFTTSAPTIAGGSGGASSCATGTANPQTGQYVLCSGGYPKPAWQTGPGVPNDKVRDIPDVSLFAADGLNNSFYPICAQDGDCQSGASTPQITGVGGTSGSSPAMAGIMALVNQKYGPQGQANFVLYPLAKQYPTAFHDVTSGTNAMPCITGSPNCVAGGSVQGEGELSGYAAGPGYDLATGLGSIDANQLVSNWNSVKFTSTTTTLTPSSTSFNHATAVNFTTSVTGQGGTPTGNVALMTDSSGVNQQSQFILFPLTNGSGSGSVSTLPGGTYHVWGQYGGDGTFGASTSSKTQITVNPESSSLIFNVVSPTGSGFQPIGSASNAINQVPYGTQIVLDAEVVPTTYYNQCNGGNSTSTACQNFILAPATGTVTFKDGSNTINAAMINAEGDAEFTTGGFAVSSTPHSITASYPGDASYNSSTASPVSFTVVKGTVTVKVTPSLSPVAQGQTLILSALVDGGSMGSAAPTGSVQFANGTTLLGKATLSPTSDASIGAVAGIGALTLSNLSLPAGAETITATYSGDTNYAAGSGSVNLLVNGASGLLASSVSGNASAATTSPTAGITISATVTGQTGHPAPTGNIDFQSSGQDLGQIAITPGKTADTSTVSLTVNSGILLQGTNAITLQYLGDSIYQPSSTTISINNPLSDFSMVAVSPVIAVASGNSTTDTLNFTSVNGFNDSVALTCTAPSAITCSLNPTSLTVNGTTAATLTVKAASATSALRPESRPAWFWASGGATLACVFLLGLPKHRRKWQGLLGLLVIVVLTAGIGCGGGSSNSSSGSGSSSGGSGSGGGTSTSGNAAAGTYTVLVSAAQGSTISHNLSITVRVQ